VKTLHLRVYLRVLALHYARQFLSERLYMYLNEEDVREIAAYTRIALAEDEVADLTTDLNAIIESLKPITEYDLTDVEPTYHPIAGLTNVMREDCIKPGLSREVALSLAAVEEDGQYHVPSILGDGGSR